MMTPLFWIEGPWPGQLAIASRPRGGDWLVDEIRAWRSAGVEGIVAALTTAEIGDLDLTQEKRICADEGCWYANFPIADRGVPASKAAALVELKVWDERLRNGESVLIHCRQGIGRSAILAAALLSLDGVQLEDAWQRIATRGAAVPDTPEQKAWVASLAETMKARSPV